MSARWRFEGDGHAAPGAHAIESTAAEVRAVVDASSNTRCVARTLPRRRRLSTATPIASATPWRRCAKERTRPGLFFDPRRLNPSSSSAPRRPWVSPANRSSCPWDCEDAARARHPRFRCPVHRGGADTLAEILRAVRGDLTLVCSLHSGEIVIAWDAGARSRGRLIEIAEGHAGEGMDAWRSQLAGGPSARRPRRAPVLTCGLEVVITSVSPAACHPLAIRLGLPGRLLAVLTDDEEYLAEPGQL